MTTTITKRYMLMPVCETAQPKKVFIREGGDILAELTLRLSDQPDFTMPYDLRNMLGKTVDITVEPDVAFEPAFTDEVDNTGIYGERYRPAAHFTPRRGWINDPNGLVYYDGKYHLFYQHNPVDSTWGNMHWGHSISDDLVHWTDLEEALFPDHTGPMFSGSAVIDFDNRTGLKQGEHDPLLLYYTAAGGHGVMDAGVHSTQRLAYSVDGGKTFIKYDKALIETITPDNRDPKVIFCDELNCYIMAIYLDGREYCLFRSDDLLNWTELQRVYIDGDDECPDIYPLTCDGERYWVMSGAHDRYLIGKFEGGHFVPLFTTGKLHYGRESYAAQTYYNAPDGRRIRFGWNRSQIPHMPFNGSMTTPHDMTLKRIDGRLCLCAWPSVEFEALRRDEQTGEGRVKLTGRANDIEISIPAAGKRELKLCGLTLEVDGDAGTVGFRDDPRKVFFTKVDNSVFMPVTAQNGRIKLRIVQDVHAVEVYAAQGEATLLLAHVSDSMLNRIECDGADIKAWALAEIHE